MSFRLMLMSLLGLFTSGCAAIQSTEDVVLDYNRSFARSRNEMLVLNILRSAAREPLQFSTMGQVQGSIGNGGQLNIPFTNLVAGGRDIISPSLQIADSVNPNVSIIPLGSREFAEGILRPLRTDTLQLFMHNGWDPEFMLPLVVGGIVCPDGRLLPNSGEYLGNPEGVRAYEAFKLFFRDTARTIGIASQQVDGAPPRTFTLTDKEALGALKDGLGANYAITAVEDAGAGEKRVTVQPAKAIIIRGVSVAGLCGELGGRGAVLQDDQALIGSIDIATEGRGAGQGKLIFRSVASIIHFLGESHRIRVRESTTDTRGLTYFSQSGADQILFKLDWAPGAGRKTVETRFQDTTFYIPSVDLRAGEGSDRTLKTLSFLDQLIALQTNESVVRGAQPILAITQ